MPTTTISRAELYELIWAEPMTKVAPRFGLSDVGLAKVCKRYDIPRPPVGYWAQKQFGKQSAQTPLPPAAENLQAIEFRPAECAKLANAVPEVEQDVRDEQLQQWITFERQAENRLLVPEHIAKYHPFVRQTKEAFADAYVDRGLSVPRWSDKGARLSIRVAKASIPRALRLMDAIIKAFEARGHKVVAEKSEHRQEILFVILREKFSLRLREKTKMIQLTEAERKQDRLYGRVKYEPTGLLELQLHSSHSRQAETTWKDGARAKLEEQLNDILIGLIVEVEQERRWRKQQEEHERQRRDAEARRWREEAERRKEQQKIQELEQMLETCDKANRIRAFMEELRCHIERTKGPIEARSELALWMEWALSHADHIDPLGRKSLEIAESHSIGDETLPRKPR